MKRLTTFRYAMTSSICGVAVTMAAMSFVAPAVPAMAQQMSDPVEISATAIGRPPIFSNIFVDVGQAKDYWEDAGADVDFRWFQRGSDTAKAVVTGDVAIGFTSSQAALNLIASGAPVVAVAGMPNQDWLVASNDPDVKGCEDLKGKTVAADGINNARYLFLASVVQTCGLTLDDLQLIDLANAPLVKAGIAGQVNSGVFHIDELAQVEGNTGQKWVLIDTPPEIKEGLHYAMLIASKDAIENNREGLVRFLEGWIRTQQLMSSSDAGDKKAFAEIANKANEAGVDVNMAAIDSYQDINYWVNDDGLNEKQVMSQLDELVNVGSVKADSKPSYDQVVDPSLYAEAKKRVEEKM